MNLGNSNSRFPNLYGLWSVWFLVVVLALPGAATADGIQPPPIEPKVGEKYYTRYALKEEKGKHNTTNYWRGNLVPINSLVTLASIGRKSMVIELDDGARVKLVNAKKYTKRGMDAIASELLSPTAIALDKVKKAHRQAIEVGELKLGMSKEEVIMARGYPPRHKTPSTDNDTWTYWSSKFVQRSLVFENGVLARGRGLN